MRLEDLDAERPPFVPQGVWSWYRRRFARVAARWLTMIQGSSCRSR
jgi:hypothetical protein